MTDEHKTRETRENPDAVRSDPDAIAISQAEARMPAHAHEVKDQGVRVMALLVLVVAGLMVLALLIAGGLVGLFSRSTGSQPRSANATVAPPARVQLQAEPENAIQQYRATAQAQLDGYGWTDQAGGFARIPITRAMTLVTRGVLLGPAATTAAPAQQGTAAQTATPTAPPTGTPAPQVTPTPGEG